MVSKDYGEPVNWGASLAKMNDQGEVTDASGAYNLSSLFVPYMKSTKDCKLEKGCWYNGSIKNLNGTVKTGIDLRKDLSKVKLADGTTLAFGGYDENCAADRGNSKDLKTVCAWIIADINGNLNPNTYGIDIFEFYITKYNIVPYGSERDTYFGFKDNCRDRKTHFGNGCTAWVIYNENQDYLHCSNLAWKGKTKCK